MHEHDGRTSRARRLPLAWRIGALALVTTGALVGCGGHATTTATTSDTSPVTAPSIDDSSVTVVPPSASAGSDAAGSVASPVPTASEGGTSQGGTSAADAPVQPQAVAGGSGGQARLVPGVADGAVALPPAAMVADNGRCGIHDLALSPVDLQGSPGGTYADFRLTNVSKSTCAVRGYVTATLIGDNGKDLVTSVRHEDAPDVWVKVAPKGSAQFHLRFANPFDGATPCNPPNAPKVRIGLATTSGSLTGATPENGIRACNGQLSTAPLGST